jgi:hypothetical protein
MGLPAFKLADLVKEHSTDNHIEGSSIERYSQVA